MLVAVPLGLVLILVGLFAYLYAKTPIPTAPPLAQTTYVYDRDGKLLTTLHAEINRTDIRFKQMPEQLRQAVIAVEDRNFYHEGGVSFSGIARAAWENVTHREVTQGGSTITQQYVKNVYTGDQRTISRKITEAIIATKLDKKYTKDQILQKYLNTVYFGEGAYGAQAAAETYWGIPASSLNVLQSATLAGLITAPSAYDPVNNPKDAKARRNLVLSDMAQQGYLSQDEADRLSRKPMRVITNRPASPSTSPYFTSYVSRTLQNRFGSGRDVLRRAEGHHHPRRRHAAGRRGRGELAPPEPERPGSGARRDRSEERADPGDGRRPKLQEEQVQPGHAGRSSGGERVQAVHPDGGARGPDQPELRLVRTAVAHHPRSPLLHERGVRGWCTTTRTRRPAP